MTNCYTVLECICLWFLTFSVFFLRTARITKCPPAATVCGGQTCHMLMLVYELVNTWSFCQQVSPKQLAPDFVPAPLVCGKVINPSQIFIPSVRCFHIFLPFTCAIRVAETTAEVFLASSPISAFNTIIDEPLIKFCMNIYLVHQGHNVKGQCYMGFCVFISMTLRLPAGST